MVKKSAKGKKKSGAGLEGVVAAETTLSHIDGKKGELVYEGYSIEDLALFGSFEEVIFLLWNHKLPTKKELGVFKKKLYSHMRMPIGVKKFISGSGRKKNPMSVLRTAMSMLSLYDKDAEDMSEKGNREKAFRIMGAMPLLVGGIGRVRRGKKMLNTRKGLSFAGQVLYLMTGKVPAKEIEKLMDVCLILHAEHGMNASTFSSRVTVATLSDMYSGIVSAIGTLKGPLHGGANKKAIQKLHEMAEDLHVVEVCEKACKLGVQKTVKEMLIKHQRIMGIGHRVYKVKDPRARILEKYAAEVSLQEHKYYEIAKEIEKVMAEEKGMYPNVDFFSGMIYEDMGIEAEMFVCLFALSRTSGWLAHILEQYGHNRLIRPRATYVGKLKKKYVGLSERG